MDLTGKVAIVTGGNGGLGRRICLALDRAGCRIAVLYNQPDEAAPAEEFASGLCDAKPFQVELRDVESVNGCGITGTGWRVRGSCISDRRDRRDRMETRREPMRWGSRIRARLKARCQRVTFQARPGPTPIT